MACALQKGSLILSLSPRTSEMIKAIYLLPLLFVIGCSSDKRPTTEDTKSQDTPIVVLQNLVYLDALSAGIQHPLVCGAKGDYPNGREIHFRDPKSTEVIHAVFQTGTSSPAILDGTFDLHGRFQPIQKRSAGDLTKNPEEDYKYFLVQSWE